jgi:hypothetical protein
MVRQMVPLLQKVSIVPVVLSQSMSTDPSALTSTDDDAVSFTGFPGPTIDGDDAARLTASQLTWTGLEAIAAPDGAVMAGGVMKAVNEWTPAAAL